MDSVDRKIVAFGDVHLYWQSTRVILDYAREQGIDTALTLGDEGPLMFPLVIGNQAEYDRVWHELRTYHNEQEGRKLICCIGDKTAIVAEDLLPHFVGSIKSSKGTEALVYQNGNIFAAHNGRWILDNHKGEIERYSGSEPLVVFHGHSHSMGVLPEYRWLKLDEQVGWLENGEEQYRLEPGKVYWVNPGGQFMIADGGRRVANCATYNPAERLVVLKTILYDERDIHPSPTPKKRE
jgi:hypothetical protein